MTACRGVFGAIALGVALAAAAMLAGCAQSSGARLRLAGPEPAPTIVGRPFVESGSMLIPTADPVSLRDAAQLRSAARLPPDAAVLTAPPAGAPTQPAAWPACYPIVQATEFVRTHLEEPEPEWLEAHPAPGLAASGHGTGSSTQYVAQSPAAPDPRVAREELIFTIAGNVVRVDADVVPADAECASAGLVPPAPIPTETQSPATR